MPIPAYIRALRAKVGNDLLLVPTVTVYAFDDAGRVLLVRDAQTGLWTSPGGIVEPDEAPATAAVREVWEEAGVHVALTDLVGVFGGPGNTITYGNGDRLAWVSTVFRARPVAGDARPDGEETSEAAWFARDAVDRLACRSHMRRTLRAAYEWSGAAHYDPPAWSPEAV